MSRIYRTHIAKRPNDDDGWGRTVTLCGKDYPDAVVFNEPQDSQPMCPKCVELYEKRIPHERRVGR